VIKSDPQIMERIAQDGWRMFGGLGEVDPAALLQRSLLALGPESLTVIHDVASQHILELVNVMVGPFYFQEGSGEVEFGHA
jgi:hypothetical protein